MDYGEKDITIIVTIGLHITIDLLGKYRRKWEKPRGLPLLLLQDNFPIHKSVETMVITAKNYFVLLYHTPYSRDIVSSNFYYFRHMKENL